MGSHIPCWNRAHILDALPHHIRQHLGDFKVVDQCPSTMDIPSPETPGIHVCLAESQTQGRGQNDNIWCSPAQCGIWLALKYQTSQSMLSGALSIAVGIMLIHALHSLAAPSALQLKWPNDLYIHNKKFGGILVEMLTQGPNQQITIGIGLTLYPHVKLRSFKQMIALKSAWPNMPTRLDVLMAILESLLSGLTAGINTTALPGAFHPFDMLYGRTVMLSQPQGQVIRGIGQGIQDQGALMIRSEDGNQHIVTDGKLIAF